MGNWSEVNKEGLLKLFTESCYCGHNSKAVHFLHFLKEISQQSWLHKLAVFWQKKSNLRRNSQYSVKIGQFCSFTSRFVLRCKQILLIALLINDSQVAKFQSSKTQFSVSTLPIFYSKIQFPLIHICICSGGRFPAERPDREWNTEGDVQVIRLQDPAKELS